MIKEIIEPYSILAKEFNILVDEPMENYTSFKIGGTADLVALPENKFELKDLLKRAWELEIPVTLFGRGTNLLITDRGIRGLVVITKQLKSRIQIIERERDTITIFTDAGERLSKVCQFAIITFSFRDDFLTRTSPPKADKPVGAKRKSRSFGEPKRICHKGTKTQRI